MLVLCTEQIFCLDDAINWSHLSEMHRANILLRTSTMSISANDKDDLQNVWGHFILAESTTITRISNHNLTKKQITNLKQEVEQVTGPFKFVNAYSSGSKAVQWVLSNIGELDINKVMIRSGCYVSGDSSSTFTKLTTSTMNKDNTGEIQTTNAHPMAKKYTIPLPYHIPCSSCESIIIQLELDCLEEMHMCCLQANLIKNPITGLLLELHLQCNGATLSDRFLDKLASLSEQHGFVVAVDEVLTEGRCNFFQTLNKPVAFISRVSYICLGKWTGMRMVLATAEMLKK
jgi:hypothetical protein